MRLLCLAFLVLIDAKDAQKVGPALKALTEWEWQALNRGTAYLENKRMSAQVPVRFHPSKLPFIPGGTLRFIFGLHHLRNAYGAAIAGWGGALVVAGTMSAAFL